MNMVVVSLHLRMSHDGKILEALKESERTLVLGTQSKQKPLLVRPWQRR